MGRWFDLAERYVTSYERMMDSWALNQYAQAKLADAYRERNASLQEQDAKVLAVEWSHQASMKELGGFRGGIIERLGRLDAKLGVTLPNGKEAGTGQTGSKEP